MKLDFLEQFEFFAGVPDSLLAPLCSYLMDRYGVDGKHHLIAANEGNCVALAAGYHLATGKIPVVYLQNSGIGNIVNPVASLINGKVYGIPCIFFVGWRGEPGVHDEPQHIFQGEVTISLLNELDIKTFVVSKETKQEEVVAQLKEWEPVLKAGGQVAFVIRKGALEYSGKTVYKNDYPMLREEIIEKILSVSGEDPVISTTGKASREVFEIRERNKAGHGRDFLTVGSMGHSSSIALGIALEKPDTRVWCIDGDGAAIMHLGAMALIGAQKPKNLVHIVINNCAHESVGGMPTVGNDCDFCAVARACGYESVFSVSDPCGLDSALKEVKEKGGLCFIEAKCAIGARADLGRPTTSAKENKESFMKTLNA